MVNYLVRFTLAVHCVDRTAGTVLTSETENKIKAALCLFIIRFTEAFASPLVIHVQGLTENLYFRELAP